MSASVLAAVHGVDVLAHERLLVVDGRPVEVTTREFEIMLRLAAHHGWVYSSEQLAEGDERSPDFSPDSVSVHVSHLRRKLAEAGAPDVIETVRGVGYRLHTEAADGILGAETDVRGVSSAMGEAHHAGELRDSLWELVELVRELERSGTGEQLCRARGAIGQTLLAVRRLLEE